MLDGIDLVTLDEDGKSERGGTRTHTQPSLASKEVSVGGSGSGSPCEIAARHGCVSSYFAARSASASPWAAWLWIPLVAVVDFTVMARPPNAVEELKKQMMMRVPVKLAAFKAKRALGLA